MRDWVRRHWPQLRLRTILFATLFVVAALPGIGAVFLRVYENTLVRQTEAELMAQAAALTATAAVLWPDAPPGRLASLVGSDGDNPYGGAQPALGIDLSTTPILPERPSPPDFGRPAIDATIAAKRLAAIVATTQATTLASHRAAGPGRAIGARWRALWCAARSRGGAARTAGDRPAPQRCVPCDVSLRMAVARRRDPRPPCPPDRRRRTRRRRAAALPAPPAPCSGGFTTIAARS